MQNWYNKAEKNLISWNILWSDRDCAIRVCFADDKWFLIIHILTVLDEEKGYNSVIESWWIAFLVVYGIIVLLPLNLYGMFWYYHHLSLIRISSKVKGCYLNDQSRCKICTIANNLINLQWKYSLLHVCVLSQNHVHKH